LKIEVLLQYLYLSKDDHYFEEVKARSMRTEELMAFCYLAFDDRWSAEKELLPVGAPLPLTFLTSLPFLLPLSHFCDVFVRLLVPKTLTLTLTPDSPLPVVTTVVQYTTVES
jgi:hypothetical protein